MFPEVEDFVEVNIEGHPCNGLIGVVKDSRPDKQIVVTVFGKDVTLKPNEVRMKAKVGSRAHSIISRKALDWNLDGLDKVAYRGLIDLALDLRDFEWCKELYERMQSAPDVIDPSKQYPKRKKR